MGFTQPHEVRMSSGAPIDWTAPPAPWTVCLWTKHDYKQREIRAGFYTLCHLNRLNNLALKRFGAEIVILQRAYNSSVPASAGTHDFDMVWDLYIPGVDWWRQQRFFRANGFACWYRHPPKFGNHIHGFSLPPLEGVVRSDDFQVAGFRVGKYVDGGFSIFGRRIASSQLDDYFLRAFGLANAHTPGSDKSWYPPDFGATIFKLGNYVATRRRRQLREVG